MDFQSCTHRTSAILDSPLRAIRQEIEINFMQATMKINEMKIKL